MRIAVLDAGTLGEKLDFSPLKEFGEVIIYDFSTPETVDAHVADADVILVNKLKINAATIAHADKLKLACLFSTGYDGVDLDYCRKKGIGVCNITAYCSNSVAQVTVAIVLNLAFHLNVFSRYIADGSYSRSGKANMLSPYFHEINGLTWGIAGYGSIGSRVGMTARSLGAQVIAYGRHPYEEVENVSLDELCARSDILSVHLPLNPDTRNLFSAEKIARMKQGAIFVNMARGAVADENALAQALVSGKLGGLGADAFSSEPFGPDHPFFSLLGRDDVCFTPHMSWSSLEARKKGLDLICNNIRSFLSGGTECRIDLL